jgi:putative ABC transport system substrate-binding protein
MAQTLGRQIASVFAGKHPAEIPVEQAERLYFVLNLRTARLLRLDIPAPVLAQADEVIE